MNWHKQDCNHTITEAGGTIKQRRKRDGFQLDDKKENATLRAAVDALTTEQKALQSAHDRLSGRHDELVERVMPVFEILAREKLTEINAHSEN